jgi:hypothetical protein
MMFEVGLGKVANQKWQFSQYISSHNRDPSFACTNAQYDGEHM